MLVSHTQTHILLVLCPLLLMQWATRRCLGPVSLRVFFFRVLLVCVFPHTSRPCFFFNTYISNNCNIFVACCWTECAPCFTFACWHSRLLFFLPLCVSFLSPAVLLEKRWTRSFALSLVLWWKKKKYSHPSLSWAWAIIKLREQTVTEWVARLFFSFFSPFVFLFFSCYAVHFCLVHVAHHFTLGILNCFAIITTYTFLDVFLITVFKYLFFSFLTATGGGPVRGCPLPPPILRGEYQILPLRRSVVNGSSSSSTTLVPIHSSAIYACHRGYILRGGTSLISCSARGWWQPPYNTPRCVPSPFGSSYDMAINNNNIKYRLSINYEGYIVFIFISPCITVHPSISEAFQLSLTSQSIKSTFSPFL